MKVSKMESLNKKNGLPVTSERSTDAATVVLKSENKIVSPFCEYCFSVPLNQKADPDVFTDLYGFAWKCSEHRNCIHAITEGPVIFDCMILSRILKQAPGTIQDLPPNQMYSRRKVREKRRKFRAQLCRELKSITGLRAVA